jgi:universal stress protein E
MKILCATDFSQRAEEATRIAAALTRCCGGTLHLVHVVPSPTMGYTALGIGGRLLNQDAQAWARAKLAKLVGAIAQSEQLSATASLLDGEPHETILGLARATNADLIVMGAHGRPVLERMMLGSVAERAVRHASTPILIVPAGVAPWTADQGQVSRLSVIVAMDGGPSSPGLVAFVKKLREQLAFDATFVRLYWAPEEYQRLGLTGARDPSLSDPQVTADLDRGLCEAVGVLPGLGTTTFLVEPTWGEPAARVLDAALEHHGDLLIMGAESRHGMARLAHPAVADRMARVAHGIPVLFVPNNNDKNMPGPDVPRVPRIVTVLAATDLSPVGNRAVPFAYSWLGRGGSVELCYIHERTLPSPAFSYESHAGELTQSQRLEIERALRALVPADAEQLGISSHVTVVDGGHAGEAIAQTAERLRVDAIALGSHGRGGLARAVVGSVADTVLRHAHRPVLVVPDGPRC